MGNQTNETIFTMLMDEGRWKVAGNLPDRWANQERKGKG